MYLPVAYGETSAVQLDFQKKLKDSKKYATDFRISKVMVTFVTTDCLFIEKVSVQINFTYPGKTEPPVPSL